MNLPRIQGSCDQRDFFLYTACDTQYFDQFAPALINSILHNTPYGVHVHVYNMTDAQKDFCRSPRISFTHEDTDIEDFETSANNLLSDYSTRGQDRSRRTENAMSKGNDSDVRERMMKTYFACARFIRLAALFGSAPCMAIDIDALVRKPFDALSAQHDFYIHKIEGRRERYLAGGLWLWPTDGTQRFLSQYARVLKDFIERDEIYWGMDQDLLMGIVPQYNHGQLPLGFIDWNMRPDSVIWTAKGTRKNLDVFVNEQIRYSSLSPAIAHRS